MKRNSGDVIWQSFLFKSLVVSGILIFSKNQALAQVIPDNTLGNENSVVNPRDETSDSIYGGAIRGQNLFHSFQEFNVDAGRGVYFANPDAVTNIFSRVTGNNVSNILGTLGVDGAADLFLINPNGIIFGENASLDVQGSFAATTASGIEFGEQGVFSASNPQSSLLTISVPLGLQFGSTPSSITNRSVAENSNGETNITGSSTGLQVPEGKSLSLLGGDILLENGNLTAKGGHIEIASIQGEGEVSFDLVNETWEFDYSQVDLFGSVRLENTSVVDVVSESEGSITVTGENILIDRSLINAGIIGSNLNTNQGGDINLNAQEDIFIVGEGSGINNNVFSNSIGNGGDINLISKSLSVFEGARINANTFGRGDTGNIKINAANLVEVSNPNSWITAQISPGGIGKGGDIELTTSNLTLQNNGQLFTGTFGSGEAGNININVTGLVEISDANSFITSQIGSGVIGEGGNIKLTANNLTISDGGQLFTGTFGQGNAGNLNIEVTDTISLNNLSSIGTQVNFSQARGNSGKLTISAGNLSILGDSFVSSSSIGQGNANGLNIKATESIEVFGTGSGILSQVGESGVGNAGSIDLETSSLFIRDGGQISASNLGQGNANNINIKAIESIEIAGSGSQITSNINFGGTGNSGNVNLTTSNLTLDNLGIISAASFVGGNGGNIDINVDNLKVNNGSNINTFSGIISNPELDSRTGTAGELNIKATDSIEISGQNSALLTSFLGLGTAGQISLTTKNLSLRDGGLISSSAVDFAGVFDIIPDDFDLTLFLDLINLDPTLDRTAVEFINSIINGDIETNIEQGDSGNIFIEATESINILNAEGILTSGTGQAIGGDISISTPKLTIQQGAIITGTVGVGDSGTIDIVDAELVEVINGTLSSGTSINSQGNGGELNIFTQDLFVKDGGLVSTSTLGSGNAGNLNIIANDTIDVSGVNVNQARSRITAQVEATNATGNGGDLMISTPQLLINGGVISVSTFGVGNAGNLDINVLETINVNGLNSGIGAIVREEAIGNGGNINITTRELNLSNGSLVTSRSFGLGRAGNLSLDIKNTVNTNNSNITTAAEQSSGGEIIIKATDIFLKNNSDISTFVLNGVGGGGNIKLEADSIIAFDDSDIFAFAEEGEGGNIELKTPAFLAENFTLNSLTGNPSLLNNNSRADVNATGAVSGAVTIPDVSFIQNSLTELPDNSINTNELVANSCVSPVGNRQRGKFIITGGDSLPVRPGNADISAFATGEVRGVSDVSSGWQRGDKIVEPQGVYRLANGKLVLSRECSNSK